MGTAGAGAAGVRLCAVLVIPDAALARSHRHARPCRTRFGCRARHRHRTRRTRHLVIDHGRCAAVGHVGLQCRYAALHGFLDNLGPLPPKTWHSGLPLLVLYAIIGAAPTAVGRWLFAPELRDAAARLQDNTVAMSRAALWTSSTVLLYLSGLLVGVAVWVAYQAWPPRRERAFIGRSLIVLGILIITAAIGWRATTQASKRVDQLTYASPAQEVHFGCGSWILDQPTTVTLQREPANTLVITGFTCQTVTALSGYQQLSTHTLPVSLSPVVARTPDGAKIWGVSSRPSTATSSWLPAVIVSTSMPTSF